MQKVQPTRPTWSSGVFLRAYIFITEHLSYISTLHSVHRQLPTARTCPGPISTFFTQWLIIHWPQAHHIEQSKGATRNCLLRLITHRIETWKPAGSRLEPLASELRALALLSSATIHQCIESKRSMVKINGK